MAHSVCFCPVKRISAAGRGTQTLWALSGGGCVRARTITMAGFGADAPGLPPRDPFLDAARRLVPALDGSMHKGQAGRIAIVGGCADYTGAPYFAAMASMRAGADLAHVFCTPGAAPVIKGYSPELIVHPYMPEARDDPEEAAARVKAWLPRFSCLVLGPGMGRDPEMMEAASLIVEQAKSQGIPLVLDADALWLVNQRPGLVKNCRNAILTPNGAELPRLCKALGVSETSSAAQLSAALGGPTVVKKGAKDEISDGAVTAMCDAQGSHRRVGGQGDVLTGVTATFLSWAALSSGASKGGTNGARAQVQETVAAAYGAALVVRTAAKWAFEAKYRSMVAGDVLDMVGPAVHTLFDSSGQMSGRLGFIGVESEGGQR